MSGKVDRASEVAKLVQSILSLIIPHIKQADDDHATLWRGTGLASSSGVGTVLLSHHAPTKLASLLELQTPASGEGAKGLLAAAQKVLDFSVNTWCAGFLDKLYASTDAPGLAAELLLATLNTNAHVYAVSPALTLVEKHVTRELAHLFGLRGPHAGGTSMPGGAAANTAALLVARNVMYPDTKTQGMSAVASRPLTIFTSAASHYSVSAAAAALGLGSDAVVSVPVDAAGAMQVESLSEAIAKAKGAGKRPFFVCATAGTTVRGAYDPVSKIADVCQREDLWLHVDASWGGPVVFSQKHRLKVHGCARANTIAVNPHKMLGVPLTCSFLLTRDLRTFWAAHRLDAGYLFHGNEPDKSAIAAELEAASLSDEGTFPATMSLQHAPRADDIVDLASLTPYCGRRADSLKMYLAWQYHGTEGFESAVDRAFTAAELLAKRLRQTPGVKILEQQDPPPCCQVCFWYVGDADAKQSQRHKIISDLELSSTETQQLQSKITRRIAHDLVRRGWMIDYAPDESVGKSNGASQSQAGRGEFLRVVLNRSSDTSVVEGLVKAIAAVGEEAVQQAFAAHEQR